MDENKVKHPVVVSIVGKMGSGKTTIAKQLLADSNMQGVILDVNHEYDESSNVIFHDFVHFKNFLPNIQDSFIIIEEALMFLTQFSEQEFIRLILSVRHKRNAIVFIWHQIEFPLYIERICTDVILLDVNYDIKKLEQSRPKYVKYVTMPKPVYIDMNEL